MFGGGRGGGNALAYLLYPSAYVQVQNIESRQVMVEWDASKLEDAEYHLEMAAGPSSDFKEIYS